MIMVLGRAVREHEAKSRLLAVKKRTFPGQPKVRKFTRLGALPIAYLRDIRTNNYDVLLCWGVARYD